MASRLVKKANGGIGNLAKVDEVNKAFQQLSQNQEMLGKVMKQNFGAITAAFDLVDGHQHITRRILNDIIKGDVRLSSDPTEGVDYMWYVEQYNACRSVLYFLSGLAKLLQKEEAEKEKAEEQVPAGNDSVFGGDYATQDSPPG